MGSNQSSSSSSSSSSPNNNRQSTNRPSDDDRLNELLQSVERRRAIIASRCSWFAASASASYDSGELARRLDDGVHKVWPSLVNSTPALKATLASTLVSAVVYRTSLRACSGLMLTLRLSSAQRRTAALAGMASIGFSSALASQSFATTSNLYIRRLPFFERQKIDRNHPFMFQQTSDLLTWPVVALYSTTTILVYRILWFGQFRLVAPSDLFKVGGFSSRSLPAHNGSEYASALEKRQLQYIGRHTGCHHCGVRRSWTGASVQFIGDHIPPNKLNEKLKLPQVYLPQCQHCSSIQSSAVKMNRRRLVFTRAWRAHDVIPAILPSPLIVLPLTIPLDHVYKQARFAWRTQERVIQLKNDAVTMMQNKVKQAIKDWFE